MTDSMMASGLFITGTDTSVGKTQATCLIARQLIEQGLRVAAYKPVCSGAIRSSSHYHGELELRWEDIDRIKTVIGSNWPEDVICPQRFVAPLAPPVAAKLEGRVVDFRQMVEGARRFAGQDLLLVEGAGGWLAPVTESQSVADLAQALGYPVLIVGRTGLGTINHTLLTVESVRARGLRLAGIILNEVVPSGDDQSTLTNPDEIERRCGVPVLGSIPFGNDQSLYRRGQIVSVNWQDLAARPDRAH